jgi:hypothetical protein
MRSRFTGKRLLLPAVAAASVMALAAPASAREEAPPPAPETHTPDDCAKALTVLSSFKLLPNQPDLGRALCAMSQEKKDEKSPSYTYTDKIDEEYTDEKGRTVENDKLLGLPVEWPKSLTVKVPTINERWYSYRASTR